MKTRYVKTVVLNSVNDVDKIEEKVNKAVDSLNKVNCKVVSIVPCLYGLTPMNLIYNIIYETDFIEKEREIAV